MAVTSSYIGKPGEPIAEKTALGLAFSGKLKNCISKKEDATNFSYNGVMISLDYITLTSFGDPPEEPIQTTEEETRSSVPRQAEEVVDTHEDGLNFKQESSLCELLEACDSMIEDYGPPLDYSLSQILFLKPEREVIGKLVEERCGTMIVSKDDGAIFHRFQALLGPQKYREVVILRGRKSQDSNYTKKLLQSWPN